MTVLATVRRYVRRPDVAAIARRRKWLPPLAAASIAAALGQYRIGDKSFSLDEAYEATDSDLVATTDSDLQVVKGR